MSAGDTDAGGTYEIREAAASWTMAHDKMLLGHLNRFGDNIDRRTKETKRKLCELRSDTKRAEDALALLTNEFMVLANEVRREHWVIFRGLGIHFFIRTYSHI